VWVALVLLSLTGSKMTHWLVTYDLTLLLVYIGVNRETGGRLFFIQLHLKNESFHNAFWCLNCTRDENWKEDLCYKNLFGRYMVLIVLDSFHTWSSYFCWSLHWFRIYVSYGTVWWISFKYHMPLYFLCTVKPL